MLTLTCVASTAQLQLHRGVLLAAATSNFQHKHRGLREAAATAVQNLAIQVRARAPRSPSADVPLERDLLLLLLLICCRVTRWVVVRFARNWHCHTLQFS
jgi:hypothetical protein